MTINHRTKTGFPYPEPKADTILTRLSIKKANVKGDEKRFIEQAREGIGNRHLADGADDLEADGPRLELRTPGLLVPLGVPPLRLDLLLAPRHPALVSASLLRSQTTFQRMLLITSILTFRRLYRSERERVRAPRTSHRTP